MSEFECTKCNKKFNSEESLRQHTLAKHEQDKEKDNKKFRIKIKKKHYFFICAILIIAIVGFFIFKYTTSPGRYDDFAKCLTDKGAVMYGTDWCKYCKQQKNLFGKSFKYVNYKNCDVDKAECSAAGVNSFPQWLINGTRYKGLQQLDSLADYSGCRLG